MGLNAGTTFGAFEILELIGIGGMGEVYRARDTRLDRDVAIKVVLEQFIADAERLARFQREARTLASLNHPNIGGIHGLEEASGIRALVLEFVEGPTLADRIAEGPIPVEESLRIALQIAEALEAAHEQGIIHRDLKPANIKLRPDGTVKVLDFGLAKALDQAPGSGLQAPGLMTNSPTITTPAMTLAGVILGTAAYMSPEQAKGRAADKRSDIWAFGCVLFEMLAGKRAFEGEDVSDTLALVLRGEPDWNALPPTPQAIVKLIRGCLQKDRKERVPDIAVARMAIKEALAAPHETAAASAASGRTSRSPLWKRAATPAAAAVLAAAVAAVLAWALKPSEHSQVMRFTLTLDDPFSTNNSQSVAISPDGSLIAFVTGNQLNLRPMSDPAARAVPGTHQTPSPVTPVFSPDGHSVAFFSQQDNAIEKVAVGGGATVTICPATVPILGISWHGADIFFGQAGKGVLKVSENGGTPETVVPAAAGELLHGPQVLPGDDWLIFTKATAADGWDKAQIIAQSLKTSARKTLVSGGSDGRYLSTGHLLYALGGVVFAVPFDAKHVAVTGGPVAVVAGVKRSTGRLQGTAHFAVSLTGTLIFVPGAVSSTADQNDLAFFGTAGGVEPLKLPPSTYEYPRVSPDGKRIAFDTDDGKDAYVWILDIGGKSAARRLTLGGRNRIPVWVDADHVAFQSNRDGDRAIFWQRADGSTPAEQLTRPEHDAAHIPESALPGGKGLIFSVNKGSTYTLALLSLSDRKVRVIEGIESTLPIGATVSPDGRWLAYSAAATSGTVGSLFVQPFPPTGATYPISKTNGTHAAWSPDGKQLFYSPAANSYVAVTVTTAPEFTFSNPTPIPRVFVDRGALYERDNDFMPDGKRFVGVVDPATSAAANTSGAQIQVVVNWFTELHQRVPTH